ncbi:MAG: hypothetical protein WHS88_09605 [Anaerohalosphaeraceae bacterium]
MNHLEQLVAEWYEYQGYLIRRNIKVSKRKQGGYATELDIIAFHPGTQQNNQQQNEVPHVLHIETGIKSSGLKKIEEDCKKKFSNGENYIRTIFGENLPIKKIVVFDKTPKGRIVNKIKVIDVCNIFQDAIKFFQKKGNGYSQKAVPENLPLLRTIQLLVHYRKRICPELNDASRKKADKTKKATKGKKR